MIGPMIGRRPGRVTTQGERLADLFRRDGWHVLETSPQASRPIRLVDTVISILRWRKEIDLAMLSVFNSWGFIMADLSSALTKVLGIPTVMVLHGGGLPAFAKRHPRWVRRVLNRATVMIAPSGFLAEQMAPHTSHEIQVIPNVIDLGEVRFRHRNRVGPTIFWMRAFHHNYNPELALRVIKRLIATYPNAKLTMAGPDEGSFAQTTELARTLSLDDSVEFVGFLDEPAKRAAFDVHDIYLHTNRVDNTPVSLVEAWAFGLPVVCTEVGGIPYMVEHERNALIVADDDLVGMHRAIERLISDQGLAESLSQGGRDASAIYSWDHVRGQWIALIEEILGGPGPQAQERA